MNNNNYLKLIVGILLAITIGIWSFAFLNKKEASPVVEVPSTTVDENQVPGEKTLSIKLFYPNSTIDPGFMDCRVVRPTTRTIPYTTGTATAALTELIKGPLPPELGQGFVTSIDTGAKIKSLSIKDGIAYVDFSKEMGYKNTGLCAGQFIQAQVEQTLLQFSTIKKVVISIEGDKEFVQP